MKNPRPIATYAKENSCIEDVLAIANELARAKQSARDLDAAKTAIVAQRVKRQTGVH